MRSASPPLPRASRALARRWIVVAATLLAVLAGACVSTAPTDRVAPLVEPDGPFGFRDVREGWTPPPEGSAARALGAGMRAIRQRDLKTAKRRFSDAAGAGTAGAPARLGGLYVALIDLRDLREEALEEADALDALVAEHPGYAAAVEARADLLASKGDAAGAWEGYRSLARLLPDDARAARRFADAKSKLVSQRRAEADDALSRGDVDAARRAGLAALETDPDAPDGYRLLARAASAGGKAEDAWTWAGKARDHAPGDTAWTAEMAEIAVKAGRFAEARGLYGELSTRDPAFRELAEDARLEFQVQNLPEPVRRAASSPKLTRSQFATLAWWLVPEVRDSAAGAAASAPDIAVDVVDRTDRREILRAIALGFFAVGEDHRFQPEQHVTRTELSGLLRRLAHRIAPVRPLSGCLAEDGIAPLARCGLLLDGSARWVTGKEGARAVDRTARMRRQEGAR